MKRINLNLVLGVAVLALAAFQACGMPLVPMEYLAAGGALLATNYVQPGEVTDCLAPYDVLAGHGFKINNQFAVALGDALNGAAVRGQIVGVWDLLAVTADTFAVGASVYWDNSAKKCTSTSSGNELIGTCFETAKGSSDTAVRVRLNGFLI